MSILTQLAQNPDLISGIYNYCDRWCERCPLTTRCLVYSTENQDVEGMVNQDVVNKEFWSGLESALAEVRAILPTWANDAGIDLTTPVEAKDRRVKYADNHPLSRAGKKYATLTSDWLRDNGEAVSESSSALLEVIQWYQYQIAVKTIRALASQSHADTNEDFLKDADGSVKVALLGIDRSTAVWYLVQQNHPEHTESVKPLILQLERLRNQLEIAFPHAREFIRPGFDESCSTS